MFGFFIQETDPYRHRKTKIESWPQKLGGGTSLPPILSATQAMLCQEVEEEETIKKANIMLHEQVVLSSGKGVNPVWPHNHEEEEKCGAIGYHNCYNTCEDYKNSDDNMSIKMFHNIMTTPNTDELHWACLQLMNEGTRLTDSRSR